MGVGAIQDGRGRAGWTRWLAGGGSDAGAHSSSHPGRSSGLKRMDYVLAKRPYPPALPLLPYLWRYLPPKKEILYSHFSRETEDM